MNNLNDITCPSCGHHFQVEEVLAKGIEAKYKATFAQKETELKQKEAEFEAKKADMNKIFLERISKEREQIMKETELDLKKRFEAQMGMMNEELEKTRKEKLDLQRVQLENERLKHSMAEQQMKLELEYEKKMRETVNSQADSIRKMLSEEFELKVKEKEIQLQSMTNQINEMKKRAEQGSMQLQGEAFELALEEMLRDTFRFDLIEEVGKGVRGSDVIQTVRNAHGEACGKIIYESKRTKNFSQEWIQKLKSDLGGQKADIAVIVTEAMPKDMDGFGQKDGVWICLFSEVKSLAYVLRESLLRYHSALSAQENKGDKMVMLYNYLTSNEFKIQIEAMVEGFVAMKDSIMKERMVMEKMWKEREKQIEKVLINASGFYGSIKGIAGNSIPDVKMLEE
ncbi:MAG: DUF2130 domain-containing protein [Cytophagales bacterium]|nr:DUF2130 domain-containing protein [Cytophagales bacterium]